MIDCVYFFIVMVICSLLIYTDFCCTENDAYNIVNGGKVVYEEIATPHKWISKWWFQWLKTHFFKSTFVVTHIMHTWDDYMHLLRLIVSVVVLKHRWFWKLCHNSSVLYCYTCILSKCDACITWLYLHQWHPFRFINSYELPFFPRSPSVFINAMDYVCVYCLP